MLHHLELPTSVEKLQELTTVSLSKSLKALVPDKRVLLRPQCKFCVEMAFFLVAMPIFSIFTKSQFGCHLFIGSFQLHVV